AHHFDILVRLSIGAHALDLRAPPRDLVVGLDVVFGQLARLSVDLNRAAVSVVVERLDQLRLVAAAQHAHVPGPVEQDRLHVLRVSGWRERGTARSESTAATAAGRRSAAAATLALRREGDGCAKSDNYDGHTCDERSSNDHCCSRLVSRARRRRTA